MTAFSPRPRSVLDYVPASQELGQNHDLRRSLPDRVLDPTKSIVYTRNPAWDRATDPLRKAYVDKVVVDETVSQDSMQQQLQTGTPTADMEFDDLPPPSQLPRPDRRRRTPTSTSARPRRRTPTSSSTPSRRTTTARWRSVRGPAGAEHALNRDHLIQVLGGPKTQPAADPRAAREHRRARRTSTSTRTTPTRPSSCCRTPAARTA